MKEEPDCGVGWHYLLDTLLGYIEHTLGRYQKVKDIKAKLEAQGQNLADYEWIEEYFAKNQEPVFQIFQIKEKFGRLRFYCSPHPKIDGAVALAEMMSGHFCEACGSNNKVTTRCSEGKNWIRTLCAEHREIV